MKGSDASPTVGGLTDTDGASVTLSSLKESGVAGDELPTFHHTAGRKLRENIQLLSL